MRASSIFLFAAVVIIAGCASDPVGRTGADLLEVDRQWSRTVERGDVDEIVSFWAPDAVVYAPGAPPIEGRVAIRAFVKESFGIPGFSISWTPERAEVSADGSMGYSTGTNSMTLPGPDGLETTEGRYVTVWRREAGGPWKCVVDIWNTGPTP